jgi:hypothetical protein
MAGASGSNTASADGAVPSTANRTAAPFARAPWPTSSTLEVCPGSRRNRIFIRQPCSVSGASGARYALAAASYRAQKPAHRGGPNTTGPMKSATTCESGSGPAHWSGGAPIAGAVCEANGGVGGTPSVGTGVDGRRDDSTVAGTRAAGAQAPATSIAIASSDISRELATIASLHRCEVIRSATNGCGNAAGSWCAAVTTATR